MFHYKTISDLSTTIKKKIHKLPEDLDLIVGIPRSGMIPAYTIGLFLNLPVCSLDEWLSGILPSHGNRNLDQKPHHDPRHILVVDDSVWSGGALAKAKERIGTGCRVSYLAVYALEESKDIPDYFFEIVPLPRLFQWNYLNHHILQSSCVDIDGVLCVDPTEEQNDDGEKYIDFILHAKPLFLPPVPIFALVTSRLEKYRKETEHWLTQHKVIYQHLFMLDLPSKEERIRLGAHGSHKATIYAKFPNTKLFLESERKQAIEIAKRSGKPVICVETDELFQGDQEQMIAETKSFLMGKEFFFFAAGADAEKVLYFFKKHQIPLPLGICDNSADKWGSQIEGIPVLSLKEAQRKHPNLHIIISSGKYHEEIYKNLTSVLEKEKIGKTKGIFWSFVYEEYKH